MTAPAAFKVAVVQMVSTPRVDENLAAAAKLIARAAGQGAKLVVLPEYFCILGMRDTDKVAAKEEDGAGPIQEFLSETARRHGVWLVGGSVPLACSDPGKVRNSCLVYDLDGRRVARYDKITCSAWSSEPNASTRRGRSRRGPTLRDRLALRAHRALGVLRRALSRALSRARAAGHHPRSLGIHRDHGARALGDAAARPRDREPRLGARASARREAPERPSDARPQHGGRSWGKVIAERAAGPGVVVAEIDPAFQAKMRRSLPRSLIGCRKARAGLEYRLGHPHIPFMNAPEQLFSTAQSFLLAPHDLETGKLAGVFGSLLSHRLDYADLYFQYSRSEGWSLEEGIVKSGSFSIDQGVGVRAIAGEKTAFAYSDEISLPALEDAAKATRAIAASGGNRHPVAVRKAPASDSISRSTRSSRSKTRRK